MVVNHDILAQLFSPQVTEAGVLSPDELWQHLVGDLLDVPDTMIDSILFCWSEGNEAPYPSTVLPTLLDHPIFEHVPQDLDLVRLCCERARARGVEAIFSLRISGGDHDRTNGGFQPIPKLAAKWDHPERLIDWSPDPADARPTPDAPKVLEARYHPAAFWDFASSGTRAVRLAALREVAESYDFDGIDLDFARNSPVLHPGQQWASRQHLTSFVRSVRSMLDEVGARRGRPFTLSARVPETIVGCHFDGIDIERWVSEGLVDFLVLVRRKGPRLSY